VSAARQSTESARIMLTWQSGRELARTQALNTS
jgi:hypothetical protein